MCIYIYIYIYKHEKSVLHICKYRKIYTRIYIRYIERYIYIYIYLSIYKPSKVKKQFSDVRNISSEDARRPKIKGNFSTTSNLITQYNPILPNIKTVLKEYLLVLHNNQEMPQIFPENTINVTYKRNRNLKKLISPSLFLKIIKENNCSIEKCSRRRDNCKIF